MKHAVLSVSIALATACSPRIDLSKAIAPETVTTDWADAGGAFGKNKIVPVISFRLKNVSDRTLGQVQVNAVFRRVTDPAEWSTGYLPTAAGELPPGAETGPLVIKGLQGYTGADDPDAMLRNSHFVDAKVDLYARAGSSNWTRIGEYPIARQLLNAPSP